MSERDWGIDDPNDTYWYNTRTKEVERGPQSLGIDRIGPFTSPEDAARALDIVEERAKRIREEDQAEDR